MVGPAYARAMARYDAWQSESPPTAADRLDEAAREADRGAHSGSVRAALSRLLWADAMRMWTSRPAGWETPRGGIAESVRPETGRARLRAGRADADGRIVARAEGLAEAALDGAPSWWSGAAGREVAGPRALRRAHDRPPDPSPRPKPRHADRRRGGARRHRPLPDGGAREAG